MNKKSKTSKSFTAHIEKWDASNQPVETLKLTIAGTDAADAAARFEREHPLPRPYVWYFSSVVPGGTIPTPAANDFRFVKGPATIRFTRDIDGLNFLNPRNHNITQVDFNKGDELVCNLSPGLLGSVNITTADGTAPGVDREAFGILKQGIPALP